MSDKERRGELCNARGKNYRWKRMGAAGKIGDKREMKDSGMGDKYMKEGEGAE